MSQTEDQPDQMNLDTSTDELSVKMNQEFVEPAVPNNNNDAKKGKIKSSGGSQRGRPRSTSTIRSASKKRSYEEGYNEETVECDFSVRIRELEDTVKAKDKQIKQLESKLQKEFKTVGQKYDEIISRLEKKIDELSEKIEHIEIPKQSSEFPALNNATKDNAWVTLAKRAAKTDNATRPKLPDLQKEIINSAAADILERERRKQNVLITGVSLSTAQSEVERQNEDKQKLQTLFDSIGIKINNLFTFRRFNPEKVRNRAAPPILVKLPEGHTRENVLGAAKKLRDIDGYKSIYINPDLTESERSLDWSLRQERKRLNEEENKTSQPFRWAIRGAQLVRFKHAPANSI